MNSASEDRWRDLRPDPENDTPLYLQLARKLGNAIHENRWKNAGEALPSERVLSDALGVSRITARKAIAPLVEQGLIRRTQGAGSFITPRYEDPLSRLSSFSEMLRRDKAARALSAADQPLFDQERNCLARGDPRHTERVRQHPLGRQRLACVPAVFMNRVAELASELQIKWRIVFRVRAQIAPAVFRGRVHVADARRASGNSMTLARCVIAGFCLGGDLTICKRINWCELGPSEMGDLNPLSAVV